MLGMLQIIGEMHSVEHMWIGFRNILCKWTLSQASKAFRVTPNSSSHLVLFSEMQDSIEGSS